MCEIWSRKSGGPGVKWYNINANYTGIRINIVIPRVTTNLITKRSSLKANREDTMKCWNIFHGPKIRQKRSHRTAKAKGENGNNWSEGRFTPAHTVRLWGNGRKVLIGKQRWQPGLKGNAHLHSISTTWILNTNMQNAKERNNTNSACLWFALACLSPELWDVPCCPSGSLSLDSSLTVQEGSKPSEYFDGETCSVSEADPLTSGPPLFPEHKSPQVISPDF